MIGNCCCCSLTLSLDYLLWCVVEFIVRSKFAKGSVTIVMFSVFGENLSERWIYCYIDYFGPLFYLKQVLVFNLGSVWLINFGRLNRHYCIHSNIISFYVSLNRDIKKEPPRLYIFLPIIKLLTDLIVLLQWLYNVINLWL